MLVNIDKHYQEMVMTATTINVGNDHKPFSLRSIRQHNEGFLIKTGEINNPEEAGLFRLQPIFLSSLQRKPKEGIFLPDQVLDLDVFSDDDELLGKISEVIVTGANDVYVVSTPEGGELLLPAIPEVILEINIEKGKMVAHLLPGLK